MFVLNSKYPMYDLLSNVISFCVWHCDMGKINVDDKIVNENMKKRENMEITIFFT